MYPALAVVEAMQSHAPPPAVLWVGTADGMEADIVPRAGVPFKAIEAAGVHGVGWRRLPGNVLKLMRGLGQTLEVVRQFRPQVVLVTGGFLAVPAALAAWLNRVPVLMYQPDVEPGLALHVVAWLATRIALTAPHPRYPARKVALTGYPVRAQLRTATREQGRAALNLPATAPVILVTGGSKGAHSLNRAVWEALSAWLPLAHVVHLTGQADAAQAAQQHAALPADLRARYHPCPFLHEMGWALAAADVVVSRAGASALGEYPLFGLPAVLVPYPHAWRYQKVNADYLAERGAALRVDDTPDLAERLTATVRDLLNDPPRRAAMQAHARQAATPQAAHDLAQLALTLAQERPA